LYRIAIDESEQRIVSPICAHHVEQSVICIGVPDRGAGRAVAPLGFEKLVKFGQMRWAIRAFRGLNFSR